MDATVSIWGVTFFLAPLGTAGDAVDFAHASSLSLSESRVLAPDPLVQIFVVAVFADLPVLDA